MPAKKTQSKYPRVRTEYDRTPVRVRCLDNLARDSFRDECDINRIVNQYLRTGMVTHVAAGEPIYGDAPSISYHEALCIAAERAIAESEGVGTAPEEKTPPEASQAELEATEGSEDPDTGATEDEGGT